MADRERPTLQREQFAHPAALDAWIQSAQRTLDGLRDNPHSSPIMIEDWADLIEQANDMRDDVQQAWDAGHRDVVAEADRRAVARGAAMPENSPAADGPRQPDTGDGRGMSRGGGKKPATRRR